MPVQEKEGVKERRISLYLPDCTATVKGGKQFESETA